MRISRKYVDITLARGHTVDIPAQHGNYLSRVLRLRTGDELYLFNGVDGIDYRCRLLTLSKQKIQVQILDNGEAEAITRLNIHLAIGISRGERMDFALQKAVELGVNSISPLFTERSIVRLDTDRASKKMKHWQGVIIATCEQSGRRRLPVLNAPSALTEWLALKPQQSLILDHRAENTLANIPPPDSSIGLLVGPEGGWTEVEKQTAISASCIGVSLGPRVLRTETAPLAAIAAIQILWGDFR